MPSGCLAPCGCDDGGEVLDLERIDTCSAHVLEGSPKVVHRAGMVLPLEVLSSPIAGQSPVPGRVGWPA
jgi:hypothetical protein